MSQTWLHTAFRPLKEHLPGWVSTPIRSVATAVLAPVLFSWRSGHLRSSFSRAAVSTSGAPLPWYTYPSIDFLKHRSYQDRIVLEFGAGQSTLWWAARAKRVVAFEGDEAWFRKVQALAPANAALHFVPSDEPGRCVQAVQAVLTQHAGTPFDVVIIDGLCRFELIEVAASVVSHTGIVICDNAEGYGFQEGFRNRGFDRVDFFGNAPGVVLPHCTSIYFRPGAFVFDSDYDIPNIALDA